MTNNSRVMNLYGSQSDSVRGIPTAMERGYGRGAALQNPEQYSNTMHRWSLFSNACKFKVNEYRWMVLSLHVF